MAVGHGLGWPHRNRLLQNLSKDLIEVKNACTEITEIKSAPK